MPLGRVMTNRKPFINQLLFFTRLQHSLFLFAASATHSKHSCYKDSLTNKQ
jgi:hypothetical protein